MSTSRNLCKYSMKNDVPLQQAVIIMIHLLIERPAVGCLNTSALSCDEDDINFFIGL